MLFTTYGEIMQVRMRATQQLRGQAFIVFKEQPAADKALKELQNLAVFGTKIVSKDEIFSNLMSKVAKYA